MYEADEIPVDFVIAGMSERVSRDTAWPPHSHPTHELLWNERGVSTVRIDQRTWMISTSFGLWIPAGVPHSGAAPAGTWYRTSHFGIRQAPPLADRPVAVEIDPLLRLLLARLDDPRLAADSRDLTERMVLDLLSPSERQLCVQDPHSELLRPILLALEEDPADQRGLAAWAAELRVSSRTITRAFRAETGLSFGRWRTLRRAQCAARLLAAGEQVQSVAVEVGYRSVSAFGVAFQQVTGLTPGQFRGD
ncbi:helix-turn-helix domain-containing protein [Leucobacter weissii]|uniref:HTH-type transcriptional regulator RipA n=2 Tax=Leucobacter weissii TaxID=1983706 RepID=A0A939MM07_9MICO|nr:helix-turn-helix domain-containing protein [Leucobacter weissii]